MEDPRSLTKENDDVCNLGDTNSSYAVSIMEFEDGKVARETQYFGDAFEPGPSRARWVERMR